MIADHVMLLHGTRVGRQTVMGSGAQGRHDTDYPDGSTWVVMVGTFCLSLNLSAHVSSV